MTGGTGGTEQTGELELTGGLVDLEEWLDWGTGGLGGLED